jgi:hypothetical protein
MQLGCLDVDGVLCTDCLGFVASQKAKQSDVFVQVFQRKFHRFASGQAVHAHAGKVAHHDELGQVALGQTREVAQGLVKRSVQVFAQRLLLDQQHAGPEQVNETLASAVFFHRQLKGGHAFVGDAENFKKRQPEGFGLAVFVCCVGPGARKGQCAAFDFVPTQGYGNPQSIADK